MEFSYPLEIAKQLLNWETLKMEATQQAQVVWEKRLAFADFNASNNYAQEMRKVSFDHSDLACSSYPNRFSCSPCRTAPQSLCNNSRRCSCQPQLNKWGSYQEAVCASVHLWYWCPTCNRHSNNLSQCNFNTWWGKHWLVYWRGREQVQLVASCPSEMCSTLSAQSIRELVTQMTLDTTMLVLLQILRSAEGWLTTSIKSFLSLSYLDYSWCLRYFLSLTPLTSLFLLILLVPELLKLLAWLK